MNRTQSKVALALMAFATLAGAAQAVTAPKNGGDLAARQFSSASVATTSDIDTLDNTRSIVGRAVQSRFETFRLMAGGTWTADVDKRTGAIAYAEGSGVPFVPGRGNHLDAHSIAAFSRTGAVDLATMEAVTRSFLPTVADMLAVDPSQLVINQGRSGQPASHVWFVDFDIVRNGMKVEGARVVFRVNNGNLIQFGTENLPAATARVPAQKLTRAMAREALADYLGGFQAGDRFVDRGTLHLVSVDLDDAGKADGFAIGSGRGLQLLWSFTFKRAGQPGTWQGRVDATTGEVVEFKDANEYGSIQGGAYVTDKTTGVTETIVPMPFANYSGTTSWANSGGLFSGTSGTTTLTGKYVKITDSCGSISKAADASGLINLGTSSATDCSSGGGGAGDTRSARTQFYNVNRAKEVGRGWLPSNSWLGAQLNVKVNLNQTCNAYWDGTALNFFKSGGGCNNTGELPGVSLHEYGHGLDSNDGSGSSADNGTGETYGDFTAALATHASCIGNGFLTSNCGGYGDACTSCTGVRDIDYAKHSSNAPATVANFTQTKCPTSSNYKGPCGKEGHCESLVSSQALWDLAARDLPSPGTGSAWAITDRLWYLSRSTATKGFSCTASGTYTSNGCITGSYFRTMRAVDDDNGNLADGTPHGGAIGAAFNRHGIACTTDTAWNTTHAGVTPPSAPSLALTAGDNSATLAWSGSTGVFDVYRNERGCNAGFIKVANDVSGNQYTDTAVANGFTYYYQVVAQPSGNEAAASAPSTCESVTPVSSGGGTCTPPAAPTGVSASAASTSQVNLSWSAASGASEYHVYRSTTSGSGYTSVGTATSTSFSDTGLTCGTTYYYVVRSANSSTCESGNSTQASAATTACSGGGNQLTNGVPVTGIGGSTGTQFNYTMAVPAGATNLKFVTSGGSGDGDLYVKFGSAPTTSSYDCRSWVTGNNETCTFASPSTGTYYVMINAYSTFSGMSLTGSYTAGSSNTAPTANFTYSVSNLTVSFTDASTDSDGSIASRSWNFGDGTTSTATNPSKTYSSSGTYTVTLTVTDNGGLTNSTSKSVTVTAGNTAPTANFTYTASNLVVSFTDTSTDSDGSIASRSWNFGDGTTSTATNPSKTYSTAGTYTVTLTVTDNGGLTNSTSKSVAVTSGGGSDPCTGCTKYTGSLSSGGSAIQPNGTYYQSTVSGSHQGWLEGPSSGADFDLYLYKWSGSRWVQVASSLSSTSNETISYSGTAGYYYYKVYSYSGSGSYSLWIKKP